MSVLWYLKLLEEDLRECLSEVGRAEDGLDDDHSSVARVHQQVSDEVNGKADSKVMQPQQQNYNNRVRGEAYLKYSMWINSLRMT